MKFPFTSIEPLIDQVKSELKSMNQQGNISTDDCYMWAMDVAKEIAIGEDGLDNETVFITIKNRSGHLPKDFYVAKEIWSCYRDKDYNSSTAYTVSIGPSNEFVGYTRGSIMRPGDSQTMRFCSKDFANPGISPGDMSYILRVPPGTIRTSFHEGVIQLTYYRMKSDGNILVPDEIHTKKAIINYIKYKLFEEKFLMQEIPAVVYQTIKQDYEDEVNAAKQLMKFSDPQNNVFEALEMSNRYRRFRL